MRSIYLWGNIHDSLGRAETRRVLKIFSTPRRVKNSPATGIRASLTCCNTLQHNATHRNTRNTSKHTYTYQNVCMPALLFQTATPVIESTHSATHCIKTLPHTATHCNTIFTEIPRCWRYCSKPWLLRRGGGGRWRPEEVVERVNVSFFRCFDLLIQFVTWVREDRQQRRYKRPMKFVKDGSLRSFNASMAAFFDALACSLSSWSEFVI